MQEPECHSQQLKIQYLEREGRNQQNQITQLEKIYTLYQEDLKELTAGQDQTQLEQFQEMHQKEQQALLARIAFLEQERDTVSAKLLISQQIRADKLQMEKDVQETLKEELEEVKENLERKEYLLQFNEQKYYQYEKVLRDLILNKNTPEGVKD